MKKGADQIKTDDSLNTITDLLESLTNAYKQIYFPPADRHGNPNLSRFFFENGRLPFIDDEIKPWKYRGWLIPYLQLCENHPLVSPRYDYVLRTIDAGRLLDEPIPQISFCGEFEPAVKPGMKMLNDLVAQVEYKSGSWNGMREFCQWLAFALGVITEASNLDEKLQEHLYRNFNLEPLLLNPSDYFGQMLCEQSHGKRNGFFPTPIHIVEVMTRITNAGKTGNKTEKTVDPCVGTGRMLLSASNFSLRLYGQDIDYLCCLITKINLALYAPWFYIPDSFFDDAEAIEFIEADSASNEVQKQAMSEPVEPENTAQTSTLSLFEQMRLQKGNLKKKKSKKFSISIDQPGLFNFKEQK